MPKTSEAKLRAIAKYKTTKEVITVTVDKGRKDELKAHAAACGESLNAFVVRAIAETEQRDKSGRSSKEVP